MVVGDASAWIFAYAIDTEFAYDFSYLQTQKSICQTKQAMSMFQTLHLDFIFILLFHEDGKTINGVNGSDTAAQLWLKIDGLAIHYENEEMP